MEQMCAFFICFLVRKLMNVFCVVIGTVKNIFGNVDITRDSYFDWQYRDNPNGKAIVLLAYDDDSKKIFERLNLKKQTNM